MPELTDEELLAYVEEQLATEQSVAIEIALRQDQALAARLRSLLASQDQGEYSVGNLWRRERLSCPPRGVWAAYVGGRLGDGISEYLRFHLEVVGCRICSANLSDLKHTGGLDGAETRTKKFFQSSAGHLPRD
ncbi:hypothetical protein [Schlesneria paludicola]|uniref:hypothetical protein n=1 Tax=Schlesneria paludicola TaxID=360056 RepID=UPI000299F491|nr:hypothetical protein [Schlesneria paludicola]